MARPYRIGMIVPSSNVTMETEVPAMLNRRQGIAPEAFTFHSNRMRMLNVTEEELKRMDAASDGCTELLADARCDVIAYACLIGIMAQGKGYHKVSEERLSRVAADTGGPAPVVTSAGALVRGIDALGVKKVALITPYLCEITDFVIDYMDSHGITVVDSISLGVPDNLDVAALDPHELPKYAERLDKREAEAIVLSTCVQMPSLPVIQEVEDRYALPVLSAAVATVHDILKSLSLEPAVPQAGRLLSPPG